jgi:hypothetical protein
VNNEYEVLSECGEVLSECGPVGEGDAAEEGAKGAKGGAPAGGEAKR